MSAFGGFLMQNFNIKLVFNFEGLVLASMIFSLPFMLSPIQSAFAQVPKYLIECSYTLGKGKIFLSLQDLGLDDFAWQGVGHKDGFTVHVPHPHGFIGQVSNFNFNDLILLHVLLFTLSSVSSAFWKHKVNDRKSQV